MRRRTCVPLLATVAAAAVTQPCAACCNMTTVDRYWLLMCADLSSTECWSRDRCAASTAEPHSAVTQHPCRAGSTWRGGRQVPASCTQCKMAQRERELCEAQLGSQTWALCCGTLHHVASEQSSHRFCA